MLQSHSRVSQKKTKLSAAAEPMAEFFDCLPRAAIERDHEQRRLSTGITRYREEMNSERS